MKRQLLCLFIIVLLSACGTRKANVSTTKAARAAEVMANLKSKDLYRFITAWTGVRYKLGGMDKQGIDCSGFALILEREIYGLTLPRRSKDQAETIKRKNKDNLHEGDLIFFSFGGNEVDHVGVYLNDDFFVHASTTRGVIVDDLTLPIYQKAIVKTGTLK
ncbi:MAG TPA: NlpC/P60 family protein [Pedobacter sp.]|nr:NlpC/P60 family protein [Pedobacter sp.]